RYQKRIAQCAKFLVDNQIRGYWALGSPSIYVEDIEYDLKGKKPAGPAPMAPAAGGKEQPGLRIKPAVKNKIKITKDRDGEGPAIHSCTHYAALGLRACYDAGMILPANVVDPAMKWLRDSQKKDSAGAEDLGESAPVGGVKRVAPQGWSCSADPGYRAYGSMT